MSGYLEEVLFEHDDEGCAHGLKPGLEGYGRQAGECGDELAAAAEAMSRLLSMATNPDYEEGGLALSPDFISQVSHSVAELIEQSATFKRMAAEARAPCDVRTREA